MRIAIASGKGGTGKTFISTNLFWTIQKAGIPVTLVDCDSEEPNVREFIAGDIFSQRSIYQLIPQIDKDKCLYCGKCYEYCNYSAIIYLPATKFIQVIPELCHDCGACSFACPNAAIIEHDKHIGEVKSVYINSYSELIEGSCDVGVMSPIRIIKEAIKDAENQSFSIFDSPPGTSCPFITTTERADYVILVTEPTPFGLNDLKISVEILTQMNKKYGVIINRSGIGSDAVYKWLKANNIPLLMQIPYDREIAQIYSDGRLLVQENEKYRTQFLALYKKLLNTN